MTSALTEALSVFGDQHRRLRHFERKAQWSWSCCDHWLSSIPPWPKYRCLKIFFLRLVLSRTWSPPSHSPRVRKKQRRNQQGRAMSPLQSKCALWTTANSWRAARVSRRERLSCRRETATGEWCWWWINGEDEQLTLLSAQDRELVHYPAVYCENFALRFPRALSAQERELGHYPAVYCENFALSFPRAALARYRGEPDRQSARCCHSQHDVPSPKKDVQLAPWHCKRLGRRALSRRKLCPSLRFPTPMKMPHCRSQPWLVWLSL